MVKYCSDCDKVYYDEYNYCPMCSAKLREIDEDFLKIKQLIEYHCNSDKKIFKIDEENKLVSFEWNDEYLSLSFDEIIVSHSIKSDPFPIAGIIDICCGKKEWDKRLKKDMPDFEKKLTCGEVGCCINFIRSMSVSRVEGKPKFITPPTIADFSAEDILRALKNCGLIHGFTEIIENELFLILTKTEYDK